MKKKILIVGNARSQHLINLALKVKKYRAEIQLDIFDVSSNLSEVKNNPYNQVFYCNKSFPSIVYKLPFLGGVIRRSIDLKRAVRKIKGKYDLVNVHYVTLDAYFLWTELVKKSKTIMLSPWGSDVYRFRKSFFKKIKSVYDRCNYVSAPKIKFREDIIETFSVDGQKIVNLGFGSSVIDNILLHKEVSREEAKDKLQLKNNFVITCGYNASNLQNHIQIINAIDQIRNQLDKNLFLILPMTYGGTKEYIQQVESYLSERKIPHRILKDFLSDDKMVYLRKCSDVFIHAQPTDAFSGSVQEYLLTDTKVINGKWTRYPDFEKFGIPYFLFNSFEELAKVIVDANHQKESLVSSKLKDFICEQAWNYKGKQWADFYSSISE